MLCKTKWYLYQEAGANETGNVDGCFFEAPASAKQAGVLHDSLMIELQSSFFTADSSF